MQQDLMQSFQGRCEVRLNGHSEARLEERAKIEGLRALKKARHAYQYGAHMNSLKGELRKWVIRKCRNHDPLRQPVIYRNGLWIFSHDKTLITYMKIPWRILRRLNRRRGQGRKIFRGDKNKKNFQDS